MSKPSRPPWAGPVAGADEVWDCPPLHGVRRLVRVAGLGGSSLLLACTAHLLGGGELPPIGVLAAVTVLLSLIGTTVTARRVRLPVLVLVLGVEQLALHAALAWGSLQSVPAAGCVPWTSAAHHSVAAAGGAACPPVAAGADMAEMTSVAGAGAGAGWLMWVAHALAVVLTAVVLARGETWLWQVADHLVQVACAAPGSRTRRRAAARISCSCCAAPARLPDPLAAPRGPPRRGQHLLLTS